MNLQVKYVAGMAGIRGDYGYHAWNAIRINGKWQMVDPTWGTDLQQRESWWLTPKADFLKSHIPADESYP